MPTRATELEAELDTWPGVTTDSSRFECCEFTLGVREIGRLYGGAQVEIPFDRRLRDRLLETDVDVAIHDVYPDSGWLTYELDGDDSIDQALALLRLAYLSQVAILQQRGTANHELSLIDVGEELETLELPDRAREAVRERFSIERPGEDGRTGSEAGAAAIADGDASVDADGPTGEDAGPTEEGESTSDDAPESGGDGPEQSDRDGPAPDEGIPTRT